jgi:hypothetical protein
LDLQAAAVLFRDGELAGRLAGGANRASCH